MQTYRFDTPAGWILVEAESEREAFNLASTDFVESPSVQAGMGSREAALTFAHEHMVADCTVRLATEDDFVANELPVIEADKYDEVIEFVGPDDEVPLYDPSEYDGVRELLAMLSGLS